MKAKTDHDLLWRLIKDIRFAMLTHRHADGTLHAHPMTLQNRSLGERCILYFFAARPTEIAQRVRLDGNVNVSFVDRERDIYVSVAGQASVSEDGDMKHRLFNALDRAWFPGGPDDPNLELLEVHVQHAEYWNAKETKLTQLFKLATAAVAHQQAHVGEHRELHVGEHAEHY